MIEYQQHEQQTIPDSHVKIVGVGGAGLNMIDRVALDGMQGTELLALASDARSLTSSVVTEKIQLGANLTKGLGCGGDPDLGVRAANEQESEIRNSLKERQMVFVCVGLGGGTGSGAAPLVCRIARELGAFVVVFATMPFEFEGKRRRAQAETALNELSVIANALITFENGRMGELVLAAQGIHEAFAAADRMISESIQAVTRLVIQPGIINVGLDDLVEALSATRSRCLFGSGLADGENRSQAALRNALSSPLLDKGRLLKHTQTALVHICGGEGMTLFEVELLMRDLSKHVPDNAHIIFGAAVDPSMGDRLSVTIISSLPEDISEPQHELHTETLKLSKETADQNTEVEINFEDDSASESEDSVMDITDAAGEDEMPEKVETFSSVVSADLSEAAAHHEPDLQDDELEVQASVDQIPDQILENDSKSKEASGNEEVDDSKIFEELEKEVTDDLIDEAMKSTAAAVKGSQAELELDGGPRGKFEGEEPNLLDGEDLDIPPYLRNKR